MGEGEEGEEKLSPFFTSIFPFSPSLRSERFQSSYCAKVRTEAKKRLKGEGEGRRGSFVPLPLPRH